jgi:phosphoribosylanthranilate isomerase
MAAIIKICGLTDEASIQAVNSNKVEFAGFVYFPSSPRHLPLIKAAAFKSQLDRQIKSVSVLVDPDDTLLNEVESTLAPNYFQLHGKESSERLAAIKNRFPNTGIIKSILIRTSDDVARARQYESCADILLFDAKPPEFSGMLPGGNGLSFDWALLKDRNFARPWMLSGGLNAENVSQAIRESGAAMVDVSSSIEQSPGVKDPALIAAFVKATRSV